MINNTNPPTKPEPPVKSTITEWFLKMVFKNNKYTDPETRYKSKKCRYY